MADQLATRLAKDGHEVTMVVPFPNRPDGVLFAGFRRRLRQCTISPKGYRLVRCATWFIGKERRLRDRLLENASFGLSSVWATWRQGRPDVMIIESWPLLATQFALLLAAWWKVPSVYYVQDVYPEAAEKVVRSRGLLAKVLRNWDRRMCSHSTRVIVISEGMRELLSRNRQLPRERFDVIPNWIDVSTFKVPQGKSTWRGEKEISKGDFVAVFGGTLGHVSGADILIEVAHLLRDRNGILLLCIGEGILRQPMVEAASRRGLTNLRFLPFQPQARVPEVQASCDVALLTMQPDCVDSSVPSKLITYLAASLPVICAAHADSAVARCVAEANAGLVVPPGDAGAVVGAILQLRENPELAQQMGRNARLCFERFFTLERAYGQFDQLLNNLAIA